MDEATLLKTFISIPSAFELVSRTTAQRNDQQVSILRYQPFGKFQENGPRIIGVFDHDHVLSLKQLINVPAAGHLSANDAQQQAMALFQTIDPQYAKGLSFIRVENQRRSFINANGETVIFPVL